MTLENGLQIWMELVHSGLQEKRKNDLPGYDAELVRVLKEGLYPHARYSFEKELRAAPPSTERFLEVFFGALKLFSQMLHNVLGMFEAASARRSDENMRIALDFDKASESLALTLKEFREVEAFFRRVTRTSVVRLWNSDTLSLLSNNVEKVLVSLGVPDARECSAARSRVRDPRVRAWIEDNGSPDWLPFPGFPRSGDTELDKTLVMAEGLLSDMIAEIRKLGTTYEEFTRNLRNLPWKENDDDERPRRNFVWAAQNFWPNFFAQHVCLGVEAVNEYIRNDEKTEAAAQLAEAIRNGFDRPPRRERTRVSLEQDFRDLVNLPIWKKRHELYAVWIASRIADALQNLSWEWHPDGDTLRFPFSGAELATLRGGDGSTHIFWTEKRTVLVGGGLFGRKHIQPDYRIMTVPTHRNDATSLVVECKQYRKWSRKNFGTALDDYAKGCPKAMVVLVNYGPTDPSILDLVDASRRDRTFLVGDFKPGEEAALDRFRKLVRNVYAPELESLLRRIKEALVALVLVEQGSHDSPEAKTILPLLEMKAHEEMVSAISDLAALLNAPRVQALADEFRENISSIWCAGDDASDGKGIGWGFFNPKTAAAHRPQLISKVKNLLHAFEPRQDIFSSEQPSFPYG